MFGKVWDRMDSHGQGKSFDTRFRSQNKNPWEISLVNKQAKNQEKLSIENFGSKQAVSYLLRFFSIIKK
jgi:hypothetical protein